jgi:hypothetical protein
MFTLQTQTSSASTALKLDSTRRVIAQQSRAHCDAFRLDREPLSPV